VNQRLGAHAVASAITTLPRSIARLKIDLGCLALSTALPVGRTAMRSLRRVGAGV
jgi:hypothetical protein